MMIFWIVLPLLTALIGLSSYLFIRVRRAEMHPRTTMTISFALGSLIGAIVSFLSVESFQEFHF